MNLPILTEECAERKLLSRSIKKDYVEKFKNWDSNAKRL
jgi:hypothetical protein